MKKILKYSIIPIILISLIIINSLIKEEEPIVDNFIIEESKIYVDIKGHVLRTGVYEVTEDMRIYEVIQLAGGLLNDADTSDINLSLKVFDEMIIYIPSVEEIIIDNDDDGEVDIVFPISINTATLEELILIPGLGEVKAQAIIDYRNINGYFTNIEDIVNVSGIGDVTFDQIKDYIKI